MPKFAVAALSRHIDSGSGDIVEIRPGHRRLSSPAGVFALLVALLSGVFVTLVPATPAAAGEPEVIHSLVNEARAANGLAPLERNSSLDAVAAAWAQEMANRGSLVHNPNVGNQIPGGWTRWGENIAQGHQSGAAMQDGWMNSAGHYKNIMGDFSDIGVAFIQAGGTTWGVQVFAKYSGGTGDSAAPPAAAIPAPEPEPQPEAESGPTPDEQAEQQAAEEQAAAEQAAADKAAAEKAAAEEAAEKKAEAEKKAAEKKAAAEKTAAEKRDDAEQAAALASGSGPSSSAAPSPEATEQAEVPLSTSVTNALSPATNPVVLIGMGAFLLLALILLSPTLRRIVFPRRRQPRHR